MEIQEQLHTKIPSPDDAANSIRNFWISNILKPFFFSLIEEQSNNQISFIVGHNKNTDKIVDTEQFEEYIGKIEIDSSTSANNENSNSKQTKNLPLILTF